MVALFVNGTKVGTLNDIERLLPQFQKDRQTVDLRNDDGRLLGAFSPEPICPWEPSLGEEEIARRCAQPGKSLADILQNLGAQ